jgi:hypothetical protein
MLRKASTPTPQQARKLQLLGGSTIVLAPGRREWGPLLRRGWVEPTYEDQGNRFLPPLRITPDGLRALAAAMERWPELTPEVRRSDHPQKDKLPIVEELEAKVRSYRDEAAEERAKRISAEMVLRDVVRAAKRAESYVA